MTVLHLVRHATYPLLGRSVLAGRAPGHGLCDTGRAEAAALARALAGRPIRAVLSGPLERARETAAPIAAAHGLPAAVEPGLDEIDVGAWTGRTWPDLAGDPAWARWNASRGSAAAPGGEAAAVVAARALAVLRRVDGALGEGEEAVLVTHADVIRTLLAAVLGLSPDLMLRLAVDPASRASVRLGRGGAAPLLLGLNIAP